MTDFKPGSVDYELQAANYAQARYLRPATEAAWREAIQRWLLPVHPNHVLDLGSGTGRFAPLLAEWLDSRVTGVEPSDSMRENAARHAAHPRVAYIAGDALGIPLPNGSCDAAWLGYMIHHVPDHEACARELARVLKPSALVLLSGIYSERRNDISLFRYFPAGLRIAEAFPTTEEITRAFASGGLEQMAGEIVEVESVGSLKEAAERTALRADTTLRLISDEDYEAGQRAIEAAAAKETEPTPVIDKIDLLVFRRA